MQEGEDGNEERKQQKEMKMSRRRGTGEGQTTAWKAKMFGVNLRST